MVDAQSVHGEPSQLQRHLTDLFFAITEDEKLVLRDKQGWLRPNEPPRSMYYDAHFTSQNALLCAWWNIRAIVHFEAFKPGQTVDADFYCEPLEQVNQALVEW